MKFGFVEDFRNPAPWRRPFPELYEAILRQIERAEGLGYDEVFLTEHHFTENGYSPSPLPIASAIAARTRRIHGVSAIVELLALAQGADPFLWGNVALRAVVATLFTLVAIRPVKRA